MTFQIVVKRAAAYPPFAVTDEALTPRIVHIHRSNRFILDLGGRRDPGGELRPAPEALRTPNSNGTPARSTT